MNEESLLKMLAQNPYLAAAVFVLALIKLLQLVLENQRHKKDKHDSKSVIENLNMQTASLKSLVESSVRQEGALGALAHTQVSMNTNLAVAMDRQQNTAKDVDHIRSTLPGICKFKPK